MKKIILATLLSVFCFSGVFAQNWTREMQKDFRKTKEVALVVDLSDATIMGVSVDKFPTYYAKKFEKDPELANLVLEQFSNQLKLEFFNTVAKKRVESKDAAYKVVYKFQDITEKAGFRGYFYVEKDGNKSATIAFTVKDGRWNDFETLCQENIEKMFKRSVMANFDSAYDSANNPYCRTLYKY